MKSAGLLRYSLAAVFLWFGLLKVLGMSPVFEIVNATVPPLATPTGMIVLGVVEIAIGIALLLNVWTRVAATVLVLHLLGTLSAFVVAPELLFSPSFPSLTLLGEFVLKNIVLITAGIAVYRR